MYNSAKLIFHNHDFYKKQLMLINNRISINNFKQSVKKYHSDNGVYGYKASKKKQFEVSKKQLKLRSEYSNFYRLITSYRDHAHKKANINPVATTEPEVVPEINPTNFGLNLHDEVQFKDLFVTDQPRGTVKTALNMLDKMYSGTMSAEFNYLRTEEEREWFAENYERICQDTLDNRTKVMIAEEMLKSQAFDNFLAIKFVSLKRYGGEGAESMMAFFHEFFQLSSQDTLKEIIVCMPHRGRLNFLTGMLDLPPQKLFRKLKGFSEFPDDAKATGDVTSHLISSSDLTVNNKRIHVSVLYNPSHLEAVNPVSMGKTRGVMQQMNDGGYSSDVEARWSDHVLNIQVHGDAAYAGQGVNQECLALSEAPHFEIGGSIHLVVNNQLGFTTPSDRGRSSRYCTDLAKMISAPVIHVNGDDPEMVVRATRIAFHYQRKFRKDVFIDLNCFRRWGHNELDDPTFTNPLVYKIIHNRKSIPDKYLDHLISKNIMTSDQGNEISKKHTSWLNEALQNANDYKVPPSYLTGRWSSMIQAQPAITSWNTGVDADLLKFVATKSVEYRKDLNLHATLVKSHVQSRLKKIKDNLPLDWSTAEAMAFGSLMYSGFHVRISGQDVGRGTFSHRHAMLIDQSFGDMYIPLNSMTEKQTGKLELANSILSEEAVLGYEYGLSLVSPYTLSIWEAQFGDFFNGAQIMVDTFISAGESKWMTSSGLVMLLPHGYDGAGPEHSSCRLERFLQLTDSKENYPDGDDVNMHVVNPTTPAQYFHLLRRQIVRNFRKPLIVVAPKTLLRHPSAASPLNDMTPNTKFKNVIEDETVNENNVTKIIFVTGKHYYALAEKRKELAKYDTAILRVESLCPFPVMELFENIQKYKHAKVFIWSQEEPQNMGAWSFIKPRFENLCGRRIIYSGRSSLPTPAVGIGKIHQQEAEHVITNPFIIMK